jgi:EpsD family peptidyl-prolyl cis-trans isomerase
MYDRSIKRSALKQSLSWTGGLLIAALLAGCEKQPEGQVVAVVNGDEVTMQELNTELGNAQLPEGAARDELRNQALDNIINRRLLAGVAKEQGIDDSPEFIVRRRQLEEALLVQMLAQSTARPMKQPTAQEVSEFVAQNPQMFANRAILTLDQVRFPTPPNQDYLKALEPANNMAEVVAALNRLGIRFERGTTRADTATMSPEMFRRLSSIGSSEPFVIPMPTGVSVSQIMASQPAPPPQNQVTPAATNMIRQRNLSNELANMIKTAKAEAGIDYQPGFAAPKTAPTPSAAAAVETPAAPATGN